MPMPSRVSRPERSRVYQTFEVDELTGGVDRRRSPTLLAPNRAVTLRNWSVSEAGALTVRAGYTAYSSNSLGGLNVQGAARVYLSSTQLTLLAYDGAIYEVRDSGQINTTAVLAVMSSRVESIFFPYERSLVCVMDSTTRPRKSTDGVAWQLMGIEASSLGATLAAGTDGSLSTSEFEISFSYKDRGLAHESNRSTRLSTIQLTSTGRITVQVPNSTDAQVDAIVLYARNVTAGETVLRKVSSGAASTGSGSTYAITSSGWTANDEAPTNHDIPLAFAFGVFWKNRFWAKHGNIGNRLHFTELFQPQSWPALFYIDIPFERGDEIAAMIPQGDTLLVLGQSQKGYFVIGQTALDFEVRPSAGLQAGALGPRATAVIEQGVVHASAEGVYLFDGAADRLLSFDIEPAWRDTISNSASTGLERIALTYAHRTKEIRCAVPRVYPRATRGEWVLDLNRTRETQYPVWVDTDRDIAGYVQFDGDEPTAGNRNQLLSWPSSGGRLFAESTGTSANSSNITATYEGPHFSFGFYRSRMIDIRGQYEPHGGTFSLEPAVDELSQGSRTIAIGSGLAVYDTAQYDTSAYAGSGRRMFYQPQPLRAEGRTAWVTMTYQGQEAFRVFNYAIGFVPESSPRGFGE